MPQSRLLQFLKALDTPIGLQTPDVGVQQIADLPEKPLLVSTLDFFYPNLLNPFSFGRVALCNVLSDLYAMGIASPTSVLMILGVSNEMSSDLQDKVVPLLMGGFQEAAKEAGVAVVGGQTVINPWVMLGGSATFVGHKNKVRMPNFAKPGDVLVLTKPLGTQIASNAMQWLLENPDKAELALKALPRTEIQAIYEQAESNMGTLNNKAAELMHTFDSHACTDVTGFGLIGHAEYLAQAQKEAVDF